MQLKKICFVALVALSAFLTFNAFPGAGMSGLIAGLGPGNAPVLFLSEFSAVSALSFVNMGECERYLSGFGKYCLLRHGKRQMLLPKLYQKLLQNVCLTVFLRTALYAALTWAAPGSVFVEPSDLLSCAVLYALVLLDLSLAQLLAEMNVSAAFGLFVADAYFILSVSAGGVLIEKGHMLPCLLLTPNLYMRARLTLILAQTPLEPWAIYGILLLYLSAAVILCQLSIKRKELF